MTTQAQILMEHFGVDDRDEVSEIFFEDLANEPQDLTTTLQLPYNAQNHPPLPSIEEIDAVMRDPNVAGLPGGTRLVYRIGGVIVKSCTSWTLLQEAEDMLFLKNNSQVRVPTLYAAFRGEKEKCSLGPARHRYYIVMEEIQGEQLNTKLWLTFGAETRKKICLRLVEQLRLLRATPPPVPAYYGRVHHQGWNPALNLFCTRLRELHGPYDSYSDFSNALLAAARLNAARSYWKLEEVPTKQLLLSDLETQVKSWPSQPTFTHLDPKFQNMILRKVQDSSQGEEEWEITLVDWANSGWFPQWMQAITFKEAFAIMDVFDGEFREFPQEQKEFLELISESWEECYDEQVNMFVRLAVTFGNGVH